MGRRKHRYTDGRETYVKRNMDRLVMELFSCRR